MEIVQCSLLQFYQMADQSLRMRRIDCTCYLTQAKDIGVLLNINNDLSFFQNFHFPMPNPSEFYENIVNEEIQ